MSEAALFLWLGIVAGMSFGWALAWTIIRTPKAPPAPQVTVTVDWESIKAGIVAENKIVVFNQVDWNLMHSVAEGSGYEMTPKARH